MPKVITLIIIIAGFGKSIHVLNFKGDFLVCLFEYNSAEKQIAVNQCLI